MSHINSHNWYDLYKQSDREELSTYEHDMTRTPEDEEYFQWLNKQDDKLREKSLNWYNKKYNPSPRNPATRPEGYYNITIPENSINVLMHNLSKRQFQDYVPAIIDGEHSNINLTEEQFDKLYNALIIKKDKKTARNMIISRLRYIKLKQDGKYKSAGIMDSISGLFKSKQKDVINEEERYLDNVVSQIKSFVELEKNNVKSKKDGSKKLTLWLWGNNLIKTLMEKEPWNTEKTEISQPESEQLFNARMQKITGKLNDMGYNASLDFEASKGKPKSVPVDLEFFL